MKTDKVPIQRQNIGGVRPDILGNQAEEVGVVEKATCSILPEDPRNRF